MKILLKFGKGRKEIIFAFFHYLFVFLFVFFYFGQGSVVECLITIRWLLGAH